ncbi:hypothetical protein Tco_1032573 [Tanacetum coccineum]|uniref:Uncharacterized protein n=1 Tax=Tanacetum coccineum TaxID=301880 RepID=A0ABQ5GEB7_9ASTR
MKVCMNLASSSRDMGMSSSSSHAPVRDSFSCWEKAQISLRSWSKSAEGKNQLMKAVLSSSHVLIVHSLSLSSHVFAFPVSDRGNIIRRTASFSVSLNGDCGTESRSDNTVDSLHGFVIHEIEVLKGNKNVMEVIDVENWRVMDQQVQSWKHVYASK